MSAVVYFEEVDREGARVTGDGREWTRRFVAKVDEFGGHILALMHHRPDLLPAAIDFSDVTPHPEDDYAFVTEWWPEQRPGTHIFDITVEYSTSGANQSDQYDNPLEEPADIEWETVEQLETITVDYRGRPLVNAAGSLIPDVQEAAPLWLIDVTKNVPRVPQWMLQYRNVVNSDPVRIEGLVLPPRTLHLQRVRIPKRIRWNGLYYRQLQLQLVFNPRTWDRELLNRGFEEVVIRKVTKFVAKHQSTTKNQTQFALKDLKKVEQILRQRVPCETSDGQPITEPVFLDKHGRRPRIDSAGKTITDFTEDGLIKDPLEPSDIIVLKFQTKTPVPFAVLPLN